MAAAVETGVPGVHLDAGDHVCAFYFGTEERDKVLIPFLQAGLQGGDKCVAVVDHPDPPEMAERLGAHAESYLTTQQLVLETTANSYLRNGAFSTADMIAYFEALVAEAIAGGYSFARLTGEAGWILDGPPGVEDFVDYESQLNDFAPRYPQVILCLYDLERFGGGVIVDILKTHKKLLLGGLVLENPHYLTPAEFRATRS
jgi:hypothetical protein